MEQLQAHADIHRRFMPATYGPAKSHDWSRLVSSLPSYFCWSKFSNEAGEDPAVILDRKEQERLRNDGVFLWGIGNSIRPSLLALLERTDDPTVVFTPMRSPAAAHDRNPAEIVRWSLATGLTGEPYEIPPGSRVTSGVRPGTSPKTHYALVCRRSEPLLEPPDGAWFDDENLRNLRTGSPVGSSQVTSVVETVTSEFRRDRYQVAFTAQLVAPFLVTLSGCVPVSEVAPERISA